MLDATFLTATASKQADGGCHSAHSKGSKGIKQTLEEQASLLLVQPH